MLFPGISSHCQNGRCAAKKPKIASTAIRHVHFLPRKVPHAAKNRALKNVKCACVSGERGVVLFLPAFDGSFVVEVKLLLLPLLLFSGQSVQRGRGEDGVKGESGGRLIYTRPVQGPTAAAFTSDDPTAFYRSG